MNPIPAEELADAVRGLVRYERLNPHITYSAPISMADHTPYAEEAAEIARGGIQAIIDRAEEEEWEEGRRLNYYLSLVHDAIGWASYKAGRVEEGRNELEQALELSESNNSAHYHLGQVFEHMATEAEAALQMGDSKTIVLRSETEVQDAVEATRNWLDKAEGSYIAGLEARSWGKNPCQAALEALYERRHGSREGLDEYLAVFSERDRSPKTPTDSGITARYGPHLRTVRPPQARRRAGRFRRARWQDRRSSLLGDLVWPLRRRAARVSEVPRALSRRPRSGSDFHQQRQVARRA